MSLHRQLHRVVVTGCNFPELVRHAEGVHSALVNVVSELSNDFSHGDGPMLICDHPTASVDFRSTNTDMGGAPELHVLVQLYWHKGPVDKNADWEALKGPVLARMRASVDRCLHKIDIDAARYYTMLPTIETRPYAVHGPMDGPFAALPSPMILDELYHAQTKEQALTTNPYGPVSRREERLLLPNTEATWDLFFKYVSARCMTTVELMGPHSHRKDLIVDDQDELRRHVMSTPMNVHTLPNRGVSIWVYTKEVEGNVSQSGTQAILNAMQLFAAGTLVDTTTLSSIPQRTLHSINQHDPICMAMVARITHIFKASHQRLLQEFYQLDACSDVCMHIVWPCADVATGAVKFNSQTIDLKRYIDVSRSIVDLQYDIQQLILSTPLPAHVHKIFASTMRDDLKSDHYRRYLLRAIDRFRSVYRAEDQILVNRNSQMTEVAHGVLHPARSAQVPLDVMLQYASPMVLLVADEWANRVKEHLQCYRSDAPGMHLTPDMITGPLRGSFDSLSGDVGLYVAYYEVKVAEANSLCFANCGKSIPRRLHRIHTTCIQVDVDRLRTLVLEVRQDKGFLNGIYKEPLQANHVHRNWPLALQSLRNIYTSPIMAYIPKPLEIDLPEQSVRIIDVIRSPHVDRCLQSLFKEASYLFDRVDSVQHFLDGLTKLVRKNQTVDEDHLETTINTVLHNAMLRSQENVTDNAPKAKRRRKGLTLAQLSKAWGQALVPGPWSDVVDIEDDPYALFKQTHPRFKHPEFWVVERQDYTNTLHTYHCLHDEWTPCPENDVLLAPIKDPHAILVAYALRYQGAKLHVQFLNDFRYQ